MSKLISERRMIRAMQRCMWKDEARRLGFGEPDVERLAFLRWRLQERGLAQQARGHHYAPVRSRKRE